MQNPGFKPFAAPGSNIGGVNLGPQIAGSSVGVSIFDLLVETLHCHTPEYWPVICSKANKWIISTARGDLSRYTGNTISSEREKDLGWT